MPSGAPCGGITRMRWPVERRVVAEIAVRPVCLQERGVVACSTSRGRGNTASRSACPAPAALISSFGLSASGMIARVLALQQREARVGKARMDRERHRVAQAARENLVLRVGLARPQRRKDAAGRRREHPHRREREGPLARRARLRLGFARRAGIRRRADVDEQTRPVRSNTKCLSGCKLCWSVVPSASSA